MTFVRARGEDGNGAGETCQVCGCTYQNFNIISASLKDQTCLREGLVGDDLCLREG